MYFLKLPSAEAPLLTNTSPALPIAGCCTGFVVDVPPHIKQYGVKLDTPRPALLTDSGTDKAEKIPVPLYVTIPAVLRFIALFVTKTLCPC